MKKPLVVLVLMLSFVSFAFVGCAEKVSNEDFNVNLTLLEPKAQYNLGDTVTLRLDFYNLSKRGYYTEQGMYGPAQLGIKLNGEPVRWYYLGSTIKWVSKGLHSKDEEITLDKPGVYEITAHSNFFIKTGADKYEKEIKIHSEKIIITIE